MLQARRSRTGAWRSLAAMALGVLALHALLLSGGWGPAAPPPGLAPAGPVISAVQLLPRAGAGLALPKANGPVSALSEQPAVPGDSVWAGVAVQAQRRNSAPTPSAPQSPSPRDAAAEAAPGAQAAADEQAEPVSADLAPAAAHGEAPPLYAALLPAPATLRYALHYYGRSGEAVLSWRPAGAAYSLRLQGLPLPLSEDAAAPRMSGRPDRDRPLIEQASQGQLDANGLAPDRFTDQRRGRGQRAANFRRELGRIEFSGPSTVQPAWPGAQDRLSWWVQLPAIVAAAAAAAALPAEIRLFVVDARGRGELWRFDHLGLLNGPAGLGRPAIQHWQHEPAQAEGQRVELWLDPAQGHWPVQLRLTSLRTGERFELQLLSIDPAPP